MSDDFQALPKMADAEQRDLLATAFAAGFGRDMPTAADRATAADMLAFLAEAGAEIARRA